MRWTSKLGAALALGAAFAASALPARAASAPLAVTLDGLDAAGRFPDRAAFCPPPGGAIKDVSPGVGWSKGPAGTRSYALLMTDLDVPADASAINKTAVVIARDAPRVRVFHWVLVDIPASVQAIAPGAESAGLVASGKPVGPTDHGLRGANVYTAFLAGVKDMAGTYGGYDGPCPPVNDERPHRYTVDVYALDVPSLGLSGAFTGEAAEKAIAGHVLAQGQAAGTYSPKPWGRPAPAGPHRGSRLGKRMIVH